MATRPAAVAGQFYPADAEELRAVVDRHISDADVDPAPERVAAAVAPHAGYVYSGASAGHVFARMRGKRPGRVVVLGRSHHYFFDGAALPTRSAFETPLGALDVDAEAGAALPTTEKAIPLDAHAREHAIEVQLPFLQVLFGEVPIVPVLFGSDASPWHVEFGQVLAKMLGQEDVVIASTDLSHFLTNEAANQIDKVSLDTLLDRDCAALSKGLGDGSCSMCGGTAVVAAMACALARGADHWELLDYRTSAQASGDYRRVVGYGAVSMEWRT